jgi:hypothetical protein
MKMEIENRESRIIDVEHKVSKAGVPYVKAKLDNNKWYSCFEDDVKESLIKFKGGMAVIGLVAREGSDFVNIVSCGESEGLRNVVVTPQIESVDAKPTPKAPVSTKNNTDKNCELMTAKDLFINMVDMDKYNSIDKTELMILACDLVKLARLELDLK